MATKAIGTGTRQLTSNVPVDFHEEIARLARESGASSAGDFVRKTLVDGVAVTNKAAAEALKQILRHYYGTMNVMLAMLSLSALFAGADIRRPARMVRSSTVRSVRSRKETV